MADWMKTAKAFLLADGGIDDREVAVLRKEFFADGRVDDIELDFLMELRRDATRLVPAFHFLVIDAIKSCCLAGDQLDRPVASWSPVADGSAATWATFRRIHCS